MRLTNGDVLLTLSLIHISWAIHGDFRDVLEVIGWLDGDQGETLLPEERWYVAMALFYRDFPRVPPALYPEAARRLAEFIAGGRPDTAPPGPRLLDWQRDAPMTVSYTHLPSGISVWPGSRNWTSSTAPRRCAAWSRASSGAAGSVWPSKASTRPPWAAAG